MKKWNLIVDVALCENCRNCTLAAKDEHAGNDFPGYAAPQPARGHDWIRHHAQGARKRAHGRCGVPAGDVQPLRRRAVREGGPRCRAQARRRHRDHRSREEPRAPRSRRRLPVRRDRLERGAASFRRPGSSTRICSTRAGRSRAARRRARPARCVRSSRTTRRLRAQVRAESLEVLRPELGTKPRVYYRNLHRFTKCFIGGTVVAEIDGVTECVAGATAVVRAAGGEVARAVTDTFGDFKCDGFERDSGAYTIEVTHPRLGTASAVCTLGESVYLGTLRLSVTAPAASADEQIARHSSAAKAA